MQGTFKAVGGPYDGGDIHVSTARKGLPTEVRLPMADYSTVRAHSYHLQGNRLVYRGVVVLPPPTWTSQPVWLKEP